MTFMNSLSRKMGRIQMSRRVGQVKTKIVHVFFFVIIIYIYFNHYYIFFCILLMHTERYGGWLSELTG